MNGVISKFKFTTVCAVTLISVLVFGCISVCIIAASPGSEGIYINYVPAVGEPVKITAPTVFPETYLVDPEVNEPYVTFSETKPVEIIEMKTNAFVAASPETLQTPETEAIPETEPIPETGPIPETEAVIVEATPETEAAPIPEEIIVMETVVPETEAAALPSPSANVGGLASELGVLHTVTKPNLTVTDEEITLCATIIQLEVMGATSSLYKFDDITEKYWEMLSVAQCIRNRAESAHFPSTVKEVVLQSHTTRSGKVIYQFSPADKLSQYTPTEEALIAAREVLCDGVTILPSNYYYFCASRIEASFEKNNAYMLEYKEDGSVEKTVGHLTTFYSGRR